jgi:hypothetical protein
MEGGWLLLRQRVEGVVCLSLPPYFWSMSAMIAAMAGEEAEVPPTKVTGICWFAPGTQSSGLAQMAYAERL